MCIPMFTLQARAEIESLHEYFIGILSVTNTIAKRCTLLSKTFTLP